MLCGLCVVSGADPREAITVLHGTSMCDLHVRETGKAIAKAWRANEGPSGSVDSTVRFMVVDAALEGSTDE